MPKFKEHEYRWRHPSEWLSDRINRANESELLQLCKELADQIDGDQIQDLYEADMAADGYFEPLTDEGVDPADQADSLDYIGHLESKIEQEP